jgi:HAE1 family hydrophobic/amphiphilic exporter-1/multidrug efflux pump
MLFLSETIPGVSGVQIWGQKRYAMRLWIDPVKLASYGCTVAEASSFKSAKCRITFRKVNWKQYRAYRKTVGNL